MSGLLTRPRGGVSARDALARPREPEALPPHGASAPARDSLPLRLAAFAALALYGSAHWFDLETNPPRTKMLVAVAIAVAGGGALAALRPLRARPRFALAALVVLATLLAGCFAVGLHPKLLLPHRLDDLGDGLNRGLAGVRTVDWPYDGGDPWIRLTILLGAPLLLGLAAGLTFWPVRKGGVGLRASGLVLLILLYAIAATEHDMGKPIMRGFVLLVLVAAWLWLPRLQPREAAIGMAAVLAIGVLSIPFSLKLDGSRPWWNYRSFNWFSSSKTVSFDWTHTYGPLNWPRDGTTLLNVRSPRPYYWKAETLDMFDGYRWERSGVRAGAVNARHHFGELPARMRPQGRTWNYFEYNPAWDTSFRVSVRGLRSDLIIGAGTTYRVSGAGVTAISSDGTTVRLSDALEKGDSYTVRSYVPTPTAAQMRGAPQQYSDAMRDYTTIYVPQPGEGVPGGDSHFGRGSPGPPPPETAVAALRGGPTATTTPEAMQRLMSSPYGRVYRLAHRLTDDEPTVYDAVNSVEAFLKRNYTYNERPPVRAYPLPAFLFQDKKGYCQQFSGAMALMLRMAGIPARVATGFTRGSYNTDTKEYRVRDLDAHSWVEVNFTGIGWVTFDPTPPTTPASGQFSGIGAAGSGASAPSGGSTPAAPAPASHAHKKAAHSGASGPSPWLIALLLALAASAAAASVATARAVRSRRGLPPGTRTELQIGELRGALTRLGWSVPAGTTLLALERRLRRAAGPASAGYTAGLRANRYDPGEPEPPGPADRRAMRRELGGLGGLRGRLRALRAIPPWGPRARRGRA